MSKQNILSSFISLIPLSYIIGTFALNLNVLFIIIGGLIIFFQGGRFKLINLDKLVLCFFSYIIFTGVFNTVESYYFKNIVNYDFGIIIKSLLFLRYLLLYFVIRLLVEKDLINFKIILYSFAVLSLFVSIDLIFQFYYEKDIFGFTSPYENKITGPFHTEAIAGGFVQKFSLFLFFSYIIFGVKHDLKIKIPVITLLIFISTTSIIFSGNRMPLILFFFATFLIFLNNKTLKKYLFHILILIFLMSSLTITTNAKLKNYYNSFYKSSKNIVGLYSYRLLGVGKDLNIDERPYYIHEFDAGFGTWKMNKYLGGGTRSFRYNCPKREIKSEHERTTCNMHPHNYYLEILVDLGIVGIFLFFPIIVLAIKESYKSLQNNRYKYIISPFFYIFIMEVFPIKSSGSFFTTNNSVIIFLTLGMIVGLSTKYKKEYS